MPKGKRAVCGDACVHEWRLRSDVGYVRQEVFKRDKGVCAGCGLDTDKARRIWVHARYEHLEDWVKDRLRHIEYLPDHMRSDVDAVIREEWGIRVLGNSWWEANHIVPVIEGGGLCGLENYETLSQGCHRLHTAELRRRMADNRRGQTALPLKA